MKRIAIMQPTYLPWIGYFGLMQSVDTFVLLDSVQFAKRSWQQRNQIKTANGAQWLSVPVMSKGKRDQKICEVELDLGPKSFTNHRQVIEHSYRKAPNFDVMGQPILELYNKSYNRLVDLNIDLIQCIKDLLNINTPVVRSSEIHGEGVKADLLLSLCQGLEATEYVSPPGSKSYLNETDVFLRADLPVRYFNFNHPVYPQMYGDFLPYMSCIDLLFNCGDKGFGLITEGCEISS
ncbi:WbqC family protein [Kiloniella sp.]|uniref:WbqC family protein n=1 Tax=Kiloniella sp. TaxID=1938587 RepID=UPI003B0104E0